MRIFLLCFFLLGCNRQVAFAEDTVDIPALKEELRQNNLAARRILQTTIDLLTQIGERNYIIKSIIAEGEKDVITETETDTSNRTEEVEQGQSE